MGSDEQGISERYTCEAIEMITQKYAFRPELFNVIKPYITSAVHKKCQQSGQNEDLVTGAKQDISISIGKKRKRSMAFNPGCGAPDTFALRKSLGHNRDMELSSAPLHKGQLPWRGLLLTASLLIYWSSPTTAKVTVEAVPPHVGEGANVLLYVHYLTETPRAFYWYKGKNPDIRNEIARFIPSDNANATGPAYSGRETIYPNGSLLFQNVTQKDTGAYMLRILLQYYDTREVTVQFHVHASNRPIQYSWFVNGELLSSSQELFIPNITTNNSGSYTCFVYNSVPGLNKTTVMSLISAPLTTLLTRAVPYDLPAETIEMITQKYAFRPELFNVIKPYITSAVHKKCQQSGQNEDLVTGAKQDISISIGKKRKRSMAFNPGCGAPDTFALLSRDLTISLLSKRAKTKTTKKPPKQVTSNVFVVFDQIQESKEAFNMIDQNRDGFIHKEELFDMLASMGDNVDEKKEIVKFIRPGETYKRGPAYSGRVKIYLNGSLLLLNVAQKDAGPYMLHMKMGNLDVRNASVQFHVHPALPPALYSWFVNGELLSSSQELFIPNITTNNSGSYTCFIHYFVTGLNKTRVKNIEVLVILSEQEDLTKGNDYCLFSPKMDQYPTKNLEYGFLKDNFKKLHEHKRKRYRTQKAPFYVLAILN
ncbi:hypothetical protein ACRRTK_000704 [Alexandromys fortis]